jgi:hypothetical protein
MLEPRIEWQQRCRCDIHAFHLGARGRLISNPLRSADLLGSRRCRLAVSRNWERGKLLRTRNGQARIATLH